MIVPNTPPPTSLARNRVIRLLGDIWFGMAILALILIYASLVSAIPPIRGAIEVTEMQAFRHWLFCTLVVIFTISLVVATWFRIRWNVINLGVLMVHSGLLLLIGGAWWYFATKVEGDVLLRSPYVELVGPSGQSMPASRVLAEKGHSWASDMPAFGGTVGLMVMDTEGDGLDPVRKAHVRVRVGETLQDVTLDAQSQPMVRVTDRLGVHLVTYPPETHFYDDETPALYLRGPQPGEPLIVPVHHLPLFRERYTDEGYVLTDRAGRLVPSKRTWPHIKLGPLTIPTGWFEPWRLPIRLDVPESVPFDIEITGYVPYISHMVQQAVESGGDDPAGVNVTLSDGRTTLRRALFADPQRSMLDLAIPFEFVWVDSAEQVEAYCRPLAGPHELTVEIADPPVRRTLSIQQGQTIEIEGTPYRLTVELLSDDWPLMTPGYAGARSPVAQIRAENGETHFTRTVIQRFPQLSQDINAEGVRLRTGYVDDNIRLRYRTSARGWVGIVAGPGLTPVIALFDPQGQSLKIEAPPGRTQQVMIRRTPVQVTIDSLYAHASATRLPVIEPLETRRVNITPRSASAVRVKITGRGPYAGFERSTWVAFSIYPHTEADTHPVPIRLPDGTTWELLYSRYRWPLGARLAARKLSVKFFAGRMGVESWRSDFVAQVGDGRPEPAVVATNVTYAVGPWTLFQSGAAQDHWSYTILGVGNRRGIWPMSIGCILITVGCLYAFYVKPALIRRQRRRALRVAAADAMHAAPEKPRREAPEPLVRT